MKIRLHQSSEVIGPNTINIIEPREGKIELSIFISKDAVKSLAKGNDIIIEV